MMFSKALFVALSLTAFAAPFVLGAPGRSCPARSTITITADASSTASASDIAVTSSIESSAAVPTITSIAGGSKNEGGSEDSSGSSNNGNGGNDSGSSLTTSARNNAGTTLSESITASTSTAADASDTTITTASSTASISSGEGSKTCPAQSTITVTATATATSSGSSGGSQNAGGSSGDTGSSDSNSGSDESSTSTGRNSAATTTSKGGKDSGSGNGNGGASGSTSIENGATSTSRGQNNAASSTTSATATATSSSGSSSSTNTNDDQQSATTLNAAVIATGFASDGQQVPAEGQVASLTSTNNFINFCLTVNKPITNGQQIKTGSCNPAPMGVIAATTNMPSSKFQSPKNGDTISANQAFTIKMAINNLETGNFVNAQSNYYAAPQQVNDQGNIIGHSHVVVEQLDSLNQTTPTDPTKFAFFKGINGAAVNGVITADVTDGLPAGFYRMASINAAANHQPVLVAVAQHGTLDDMIYFTVQ